MEQAWIESLFVRKLSPLAVLVENYAKNDLSRFPFGVLLTTPIYSRYTTTNFFRFSTAISKLSGRVI